MPTLTREGSLFDARPEAFGSCRVLDEMRAGRFGRVFRAQEPATGAFLVIKLFEDGLSPEQAPVVARAFESLCRAPLDHPSIIAPLAAGLEGGIPWIAEPQADGELLYTLMQRGAGADVQDVLVRITQIAGALDFAAAAGIRHGALHPRDIIISGDRTLITGFGLQQALAAAGVAAQIHDDVQVLAAIAGEWLAGTAPARLRAVLESAVADGHRGTALDFAASLQSALRDPLSAVRDPEPALRTPASAIGDSDILLRQEEPAFREPGLPVRETESGLRIAESGPRIAESGPRRADRGSRIADSGSPSAWPAMAAMLAIGLLGGFAAGFVVGQRDATPIPYAAERAVRRPAAGPDRPASTAGRDDADAPTEVRDSEVRIPSEPGTPNREPGTPNREPGTANAQPGTRNPEPGTAASASLVVDSRPRGARVFIDGRLVGQTPLSLPGVPPGEHAVRIDLVGYQRWVTRVNVARGERTRVAASLER